MLERPIIEVYDDKNGKTHISVYSGEPREPHDTIHINIPNNGTGSATVVEKFGGEKSTATIKLGKWFVK